jgi:hypothetical protein
LLIFFLFRFFRSLNIIVILVVVIVAGLIASKVTARITRFLHLRR